MSHIYLCAYDYGTIDFAEWLKHKGYDVTITTESVVKTDIVTELYCKYLLDYNKGIL